MLPEGWESRTLAEVCRLWNGRAFKKEELLNAGKYLVLRVGNFFTNDRWYYSDLELEDEKYCDDGDLLYAWSASFGPRIWSGGKVIYHYHIWKITVDEKLIDKEFLFHFLDWDATQVKNSMGSGSTMIHVTKDAMEHRSIAFPPLDEQRRVAEVLRSVDESIAAAYAVIGQLREARSHQLEALMTLPGTYRRIDEICRLSGGYGFPIKHQGKTAGRYPFAKVSDMNRPGNEVQLHHAENYVDEADLRTLRAKTFPAGTTFFPKVGATLLTNKRRFAAVEMLVDNNVMGAVATEVAPWFLYYAFCNIDMANYVQPGAVPSINQRTIGEIMIPVPTKAGQAEFVQNMRDFDIAIEMQSDTLKKLSEMKAALTNDLLTGRVRVPVLANIPSKAVSPAFKRAVFAAEIVRQLHNDNRFGSVKHEKIVHLCELHLGLQDDLDRHAYKEAAGPYDPKARRSVERILQQQKWFDATKPDGNRVVYVPLERAGGHGEYFDRYFGDQKAAIQSIIDLMRPLDTRRCEIVATLYAVWNDFLIDGKHPTDDEIVTSVLEWHPKKQEIAEDRWLAALPWMRQKGLIPRGVGEKTRVTQA